MWWGTLSAVQYECTHSPIEYLLYGKNFDDALNKFGDLISLLQRNYYM